MPQARASTPYFPRQLLLRSQQQRRLLRQRQRQRLSPRSPQHPLRLSVHCRWSRPRRLALRMCARLRGSYPQRLNRDCLHPHSLPRQHCQRPLPHLCLQPLLRLQYLCGPLPHLQLQQLNQLPLIRPVHRQQQSQPLQPPQLRRRNPPKHLRPAHRQQQSQQQRRPQLRRHSLLQRQSLHRLQLC